MAENEKQPSDKHASIASIRGKIEECRQKIPRIRERIESEQRTLKECVEEYLNVAAQYSSDPQLFGHVKAQFEKKKARSQTSLEQLQAKLKLALEKQAGFERALRELTNKQDHVRFDTATSQSITAPIVSSTVDLNSSALLAEKAPPRPNLPANSPAPFTQTQNPEESSTPIGGKRPIGNSSSLNLATGSSVPSTARRGSLLPNVTSTGSKYLEPASAFGSLKQTPTDPQLDRSAQSQLQLQQRDRVPSHSNLLNSSGNYLSPTHARPHGLNKQQSSSTDALSIRVDSAQGVDGSTLDRKLPVIENLLNAHKRLGSADDLERLHTTNWSTSVSAGAKHGSTSLLDAIDQSPKANNSFRYGDNRTGERASISSINDDERTAGSNNVSQRHAHVYDGDYMILMTQLHAAKDQMLRLEEKQTAIQEEMRFQMDELLDRTSRLNNTCTLLEEHLNDQIDLHQSSTRSLSNEISVIYEKLLFESRERKHEIEQVSENLGNRLGLLEAEQQRKQQTDSLISGELTTISMLVAKLIKLAIALVSVVMLIISMLTSTFNSTFGTPLRIVITLSVLTLVLAWWLQSETISDTSGSVHSRGTHKDSLNVLNWLVTRVSGRYPVADAESSQ